MHYSLVEMWAVMGPLARFIVILLAAMSAASLAAGVERLLAVRGAERTLDRFLPDLRAVLAEDLASDVRREAYDRVVRRMLVATGASLRRGLGVLATVGATAPFVGLVGTVVGIVNAFAQLSGGEHAGVGAVSAGIAEALVTTAFGIAVAIPAVWLFNHLTHRIGRVVAALECRAQDLAVEALRSQARR